MRARELLRHLGDIEVEEMTSASLAAAITAQVRTGALPAGVELPSERDLATAIGRSRGTIARAYEALRSQGLAHTRQGAATTIGCCAGPWASSRAAELEAIMPVAAPQGRPGTADTVDLRSVRWAGPLAGGSATRDARRPPDGRTPADPVLRDARAADGVVPTDAVAVDSRIRGLDVILSTLMRPGERVLVPALTDPAVLALLRVRGLHPVPLSTQADGQADIPAWLRQLRTRAAPVAVLAASHAPPAGTTIAAHERRLLVEAAATGEVTLVEDRSWDDLWLDTPPPVGLAQLDEDERTIALRSSAMPGHGADPSAWGERTWIEALSDAVRARLAAVVRTLDAAPRSPAGPVVGAEAAAELRRQHLVDHTALTIRLVTPVAPQVRMAPATGGPLRLLHLGAVPGTAVADALGDRGVLVHPGAACVVGGEDVPAVAVSLAAPTSALVEGLRALVEVVTELA